MPRGGCVATTQGEAISNSPKGRMAVAVWMMALGLDFGSKAGLLEGAGGHQEGTAAVCSLWQLFYFTPRWGDVPRTWLQLAQDEPSPPRIFSSQQIPLHWSKHQEQKQERREMSLGVERCKDQTSSDFKIKSNSPRKTWCVLAEAIIYAN